MTSGLSRVEREEEREIESSEKDSQMKSSESQKLEQEKITTLKNLNESVDLEHKLENQQGIMSEQ